MKHKTVKESQGGSNQVRKWEGNDDQDWPEVLFGDDRRTPTHHTHVRLFRGGLHQGLNICQVHTRFEGCPRTEPGVSKVCSLFGLIFWRDYLKTKDFFFSIGKW